MMNADDDDITPSSSAATAAAASAAAAAGQEQEAAEEDTTPILEQQGLGALLDVFVSSGESVVCTWCNGVVVRRRYEQHVKRFCERSPHLVQGESSDDDDDDEE